MGHGAEDGRGVLSYSTREERNQYINGSQALRNLSAASSSITVQETHEFVICEMLSCETPTYTHSLEILGVGKRR